MLCAGPPRSAWHRRGAWGRAGGANGGGFFLRSSRTAG